MKTKAIVRLEKTFYQRDNLLEDQVDNMDDDTIFPEKSSFTRRRKVQSGAGRLKAAIKMNSWR